MIVNANALSLPIAAKSIQCIVTSPPYYKLRDYGVDDQIGLEETPEEYVSNIVAVFRECWRVLKDDGTLWLNLGDSYVSRAQNGDENHPNNINSRGNTNRCRVVKKKNRDVKRWGGGNAPATGDLKPKDLIGIPWMVAFALRADGWYLRQEIIWSKPNPMPESVTDRCTKSHESLFLLSKYPNYYFDAAAIAEPCTWSTVERLSQNIDGQKGSDRIQRKSNGNMKAVVNKGMTRDMEGGANGINQRRHKTYPFRNKRSVWEINTQPFTGSHYAVYPEELVKPCILAGSRPGDIVFDPFSGSGTTGRVAIKHNRKYFGVELNYKYIKDFSRERLTVQPEIISAHKNAEVDGNDEITALV